MDSNTPKVDPSRRWDPYLIWAQATEFHNYGLPVPPPRGVTPPPEPPLLVAILLELNKSYNTFEDLERALDKEGVVVNSLKVPPVYFSDPKSRFVTATTDPGDIEKLKKSRVVVKRLQLAAPRLADSGFRVGVGIVTNKPRQLVVGVIDDGCAYAHQSFRAGCGETRIAFIWNQNQVASTADAPENMGYGQERRRDSVGNLHLQPVAPPPGISDDEWYSDPHVNDTRVWPCMLHGTHMLDLAAGSPRPALVDAIGESERDLHEPVQQAEVIFVELPAATVADVSGASLGAAALDGVRYILNRSPELQTNLVVNLSYGHFAGSHDETGMFVSAMTDLLMQRNNFAITLPAGNSCFAGRPIHISCDELAPNTTATLTFVVIPQDRAQTFVEVWMPEGANNLEFQLEAPDGGGATSFVSVGHAAYLQSAHSTVPFAGVIYLDKVSQGTKGRMALIAIAATAAENKAAEAPYGEWVISVKNMGTAPVKGLHAWVERHDVLPGTPNSGLQPYFVEEPGGAFKLTGKRFTLNAIAHGPLTLCAGGLVLDALLEESGGRSPNSDPDYAGNGPGRGVAAAPVAQVLSDAGTVLDGVRAAGARSGSTVRLSGTSASSALLARYVANRLQRAAPNPRYVLPAVCIRRWFPASELSTEVAELQIDESLETKPFP